MLSQNWGLKFVARTTILILQSISSTPTPPFLFCGAAFRFDRGIRQPDHNLEIQLRIFS